MSENYSHTCVTMSAKTLMYRIFAASSPLHLFCSRSPFCRKAPQNSFLCVLLLKIRFKMRFKRGILRRMLLYPPRLLRGSPCVLGAVFVGLFLLYNFFGKIPLYHGRKSVFSRSSLVLRPFFISVQYCRIFFTVGKIFYTGKILTFTNIFKH